MQTVESIERRAPLRRVNKQTIGRERNTRHAYSAGTRLLLVKHLRSSSRTAPAGYANPAGDGTLAQDARCGMKCTKKKARASKAPRVPSADMTAPCTRPLLRQGPRRCRAEAAHWSMHLLASPPPTCHGRATEKDGAARNKSFHPAAAPVPRHPTALQILGCGHMPKVPHLPLAGCRSVVSCRGACRGAGQAPVKPKPWSKP